MEKDKANWSAQRNAFWGRGMILSLTGLLGVRLYKSGKEQNKMKRLAEALINTQEEERKCITRDLQDGIGRSLLLIKKQMEWDGKQSKRNQNLISDTLAEVRSISQSLHPFQLEKFGLMAAIEEAIEKTEQSTDLFITSELASIDQFIAPEAHIHIYRTIQEALSNIVKHAGANAAKISTEVDVQGVLIKIQDNGKGFDHELAIVRSKSLGLKTMYERISSIGGKLKIGPGIHNKGSMVEIMLPKVNA